MKRVFWISLSYATFGIEATGNRITDAAPIARWMVGKTLDEVRPWLRERGASGKEIKIVS